MDKFSYFPNSKHILWTYYNADGNNGCGQIIKTVLDVRDITIADSNSNTDQDFMDCLYEKGQTILINRDTEEFERAYNEFVSKNHDVEIPSNQISEIRKYLKSICVDKSFDDNKISIAVNENDIIKMAARIERNKIDDEFYNKQLNSYINGTLDINKSIIIGNTPNIINLVGSNASIITINQSVIKNSMFDRDKHTNGHTEGHNIPIDTLKKLPEELRNPILIIEGRHTDTIVAITSLRDQKSKQIVIPIALNLRGAESTVNKVTSIYGKNNIYNYIAKNSDKIIAINEKKANELFTTIGYQLSKTTSAICFDNSISYTTANVKYPEKANRGLTENIIEYGENNQRNKPQRKKQTTGRK